MCRHLAYLGPPATLRSLLIDPPHSLYRQAWAPRRQRHGTVNADGFGIGWYAGPDPVPARYRRGEPIWGDPSLPDIARVTRAGAVLAAVRSATPGTATGPEAAAPFGCGPWLFSHNGAALGWRDWGEAAFASWAGSPPARTPPGPLPGHGAPEPLPVPEAPALLSCLEALTDSALLWALALQRLRAGLPLAAALAGTVGAVEAAGGTGRLNLLLTDGASIAATACGDTLWYRSTEPSLPGRGAAASVTVASEPDDDGPGWTEVPDRHVLTATPSQVSVRPLGDLSPAPSGRASPADRASPANRAAPPTTTHPQATTSAPKGILTA
jgi:gamma-glutamyl hercynylcysteine S-oxide hydrolase